MHRYVYTNRHIRFARSCSSKPYASTVSRLRDKRALEAPVLLLLFGFVQNSLVNKEHDAALQARTLRVDPVAAEKRENSFLPDHSL